MTGRAGPPTPSRASSSTRASQQAVRSAERQVPHLAERELLAWRGLLEIETRLLPPLDEHLRLQVGLTINEFDVLYQLWIAPGQRRRMTELSRAVLVTPSGITRMVSRLEGRGWVRRETAGGRQAVETVLTPAGQEVLDRAMDVHFADVSRIFISRLSPSEIDLLVGLWDRMTAALAEEA